jgi:hypothetical protein
MSDPANCADGRWQGWTPSLVLSASGAVHVAYDAAYVADCTGQDGLLQRAVRLVSFAQP